MKRTETPPVPCWRCGCDAPPPDLDEQVMMARAIHRSWDTPYWWDDEEWRRLRMLLMPGDIVELARNSFLRMLAPDPQGIFVWRKGETIRIDRRQLKAEPPEPPKPPKPTPSKTAAPAAPATLKIDEGEDPFVLWDDVDPERRFRI